MAISNNPFALKNLTLDAQELRQAVSALVPNTGGIVQAGDLAVTQTATASMAVNVGAGRIWLPGSNTANIAGQTYSPQGMYFAFNDGPIAVTIAAASAAYPRIDVIYAYVQDSAFGAAADKIAVGIVQGAATSNTPAVPALPTGVNAVSLAQVAVAVNATSITTANITATAPVAIGPSKPGQTSYTPSLSSSGTAPSIGTGQQLGTYQVVGKTLIGQAFISFNGGSVGTGNYGISLPPGFSYAGLGSSLPVGIFTAHIGSGADVSGYLRLTAAGASSVNMYWQSATTTASPLTATTCSWAASATYIAIQFTVPLA